MAGGGVYDDADEAGAHEAVDDVEAVVGGAGAEIYREAAKVGGAAGAPCGGILCFGAEARGDGEGDPGELSG